MLLQTPDAPAVVQVRIKASKTDPFRKGVTVYLGRTDNDLCPVNMVVRGRSAGRFTSGSVLSRESLVRRIRQALERALRHIWATASG